MSMIPWKKKGNGISRDSEANTVSRFRSEMQGLFDRFFDEPWSAFDRAFSSFGAWAPSLDVIDGEKEVTVKAELPGVDPKEVEISVLGQTLTLSGEKKSEREEKGKGFYRSECEYGSFRRQVQLPEGVDPDKVKAEYANGVLTVKLEKSRTATPKRIPVSTK
jgi:HSP20 family protein